MVYLLPTCVGVETCRSEDVVFEFRACAMENCKTEQPWSSRGSPNLRVLPGFGLFFSRSRQDLLARTRQGSLSTTSWANLPPGQMSRLFDSLYIFTYASLPPSGTAWPRYISVTLAF